MKFNHAHNQFLMKRPLVTVALLYGAGVVLGHFVEAPLAPTFLVGVLLTIVALSVERVRGLFMLVTVFAFGWLNMTTRTAIISPRDLRSVLQNSAELVTLRGRIASAPSERVFLRNGVETSHTLAELEVSAIQIPRSDWQPAYGRIMSRTAGVLPARFVPGQTVEVAGIALRPLPPIATGVFDYAHYLHSRGIHYDFKVESAGDWKSNPPEAGRPISDQFRAWAQRTLARGLPAPDESLRLQWAMLLGWQTALTAEVSEPFMRSGTMHIFAISGLHIALIAGIFVALFRALALPRFVCGALITPIIWFYTCATGWQASAIRSTVMMSVILFGWMLKRPTDLLNSLAVAACIILVWQPEQLFQASFQLSFFVVLSIALLSPPIEKLKKRFFTLDPMLPWELRPRWQRTGIKLANVTWTCFATSLAAFIGSIPLIAYYFHLFTPGSLFANLVVVPVSSLALMSGLGALITGDFVPFLTEWFNNAGWFFMRSMMWLSETAAHTPAAWCYVRSPGLLLFLLYYGLLVAASAGWFARRWLRWPVIACLVVLGALWLNEWRGERSRHRIAVLPLNGGHAVYVQPAGGAPEWLIDCGDQRSVDFTLKPFLQANGVNRIAHLMLTYGVARQMGGAAHLNEMFPAQEALISPIAFRSSKYREVISDLEATSHLRRCATNGFALVPWNVCHPDASDRFPNAEDNAVTVLGNFGETSVLLASDLGRAGQNAIFTRHPHLRADIIIAGLADKGESLATEWIEAIRPQLIVITDSEFPASRRASASLLTRLRRTGATVLATRQTGAITISLRNRSWQIETARPLIATGPEPETGGRDVPDE